MAGVPDRPGPSRLCRHCEQPLGRMRSYAEWCREQECQKARKRSVWHANKNRYQNSSQETTDQTPRNSSSLPNEKGNVP